MGGELLMTYSTGVLDELPRMGGELLHDELSHRAGEFLMSYPARQEPDQLSRKAGEFFIRYPAREESS